MPLMLRFLCSIFRNRVGQTAALCVLLLFVSLFGVMVLSEPALAQQVDTTESLEDVGAVSGLPTTSLPILIARIIRVALGVLGIILVCIVLYGGFVYMTAQGDPKKVDTAKKILTNAIIGVIIIMSAFGITQFILTALLNAAGLGGGGTSGITAAYSEPLSGSLGAGAVEDHYPPRNAIDIPRNSLIMVTFKDAIDPASIIDGYETDPSSTNLNTDNVLIYQTNQLADGVNPADIALPSASVLTSVSDDQTIFVFDSTELLGSATNDTNYTVVLGNGIRATDGDAVFTGNYGDGYEWSFEVSTEVDNTPPTVVSVSPTASSDPYAPNITVSVTFSEAMNPIAATGSYLLSSGDFFDNIEVLDAAGVNVEGTFDIVNGYRTVDFTPTDVCGQDPCGDYIYCLPRNQDPVSVSAHAASVGAEPPAAVLIGAAYDGLTDASGNSLDGNEDDVAQGAATDGSESPDVDDDYDWSFATSEDACTEAPSIDTVSPGIRAEFVDPDGSVDITFDMPMKASTITSANVQMWPDPWYEFWFSTGSETLTDTTVSVCGTMTNPTQAQIDHPTMVSPEDLGWDYYPVITKDVKSAYQICMVPAAGPASGTSDGSCDVTAEFPFCCNGEPSDSACATTSGEVLPDTSD